MRSTTRDHTIRRRRCQRRRLCGSPCHTNRVSIVVIVVVGVHANAEYVPCRVASVRRRRNARTGLTNRHPTSYDAASWGRNNVERCSFIVVVGVYFRCRLGECLDDWMVCVDGNDVRRRCCQRFLRSREVRGGFRVGVHPPTNQPNERYNAQ